MESICDDPEIVAQNIKVEHLLAYTITTNACSSCAYSHTHPPPTHTPPQTVKLTSPDYKGSNPDDAVKDFEKRIKNYELVYEPLDKDVDM